jgi:hypothetical protein
MFYLHLLTHLFKQRCLALSCIARLCSGGVLKQGCDQTLLVFTQTPEENERV